VTQVIIAVGRVFLSRPVYVGGDIIALGARRLPLSPQKIKRGAHAPPGTSVPMGLRTPYLVKLGLTTIWQDNKSALIVQQGKQGLQTLKYMFL